MYLNIVTHSAHDWLWTITNVKMVDASQVSFGSLSEMREDENAGFKFYDCRPRTPLPTKETLSHGILMSEEIKRRENADGKLFDFPESFVRLEITRENGDFNVVYTNYGAFLCNDNGDTVHRYLVR